MPIRFFEAGGGGGGGGGGMHENDLFIANKKHLLFSQMVKNVLPVRRQSIMKNGMRRQDWPRIGGLIKKPNREN